MKLSSPLVWFITGTSYGFGRELVRVALERGDKVVATSRTPKKVEEAFSKYADNLLVLPLDLHNTVQIEKAVTTAIATFGHVDVLVNNAGYGLLGAVEEVSEQEVSDLFKINFFALLKTTQAFLPHFRERCSGHIINISSIWGLTAAAGFGIYNATKFAVEGLSQALAQEIKPLGIHVTLVEPGGFRTKFLAKDALGASQKIIEDYIPTVGKARVWSAHGDGKQNGDPLLAAQAILKVVTSEHPPLHLLLGTDAYHEAIDHLNMLRQEIEAWREVTLSTDIKS
ncbi:MAG: oxidoreductase [Chthoniobacterales bacterium]